MGTSIETLNSKSMSALPHALYKKANKRPPSKINVVKMADYWSDPYTATKKNLNTIPAELITEGTKIDYAYYNESGSKFIKASIIG
jgi:hypothetical protein